MNAFRRSLGSLLALSLFGLWLVPSAQPTARAATVHGVDLSAPAAGVEAIPAPLGLLGELEVGEDEPPTRRSPVTHDDETRRPASPPVLAPDRATRDRSQGPIYRVRRSGQAHRSAP